MTCPDFDPAQLHDYAAVMPNKTVNDLAASFRKSVSELISELTNPAHDLHRTKLAEQAHDLKGVAGSFGALKLQHLAEQLERCCREDMLSGVGPILADMPEAASRAFVGLQAALDELAPSLSQACPAV